MVTSELTPIRQPLENVSIPMFLVRQTPRTAFEHIRRELTKLPEWRQKGYAFNYGPPSNSLIEELKISDMTAVDWGKVQSAVECEIYPSFDFKPAAQAVESALPEVEKALSVFKTYQEQWGFKLFPQYEIELVVGTIGGGGSWQTIDDTVGGIPNGTITFWQNPNPSLRGRTPAERIVHEMVHMGIEELLALICFEAGKPILHQKTKERLVDLIIEKSFKINLFPNYRTQLNQDNRIDPYISETTLMDLPGAIKQFIAENEVLSKQ